MKMTRQFTVRRLCKTTCAHDFLRCAGARNARIRRVCSAFCAPGALKILYSAGLSKPSVKLLLLLFGSLLFQLTYAQISAASSLPYQVDEIMQKSAIPREQMGIWVAPVDGGAPVIDWQSDYLMSPASVEKIITTGVGLLVLGDDYRWRTEFFTDGVLENGTLTGDLFVKGYGNPYLVQEDMLVMVNALRGLGINHIAGQVVLDDSYFIRRSENSDAFDGFGMEPYNAVPNALNINFRTVTLSFQASSSGVSVSTDPELSYLRIDNRMTLSKRKGCSGDGFAPRLELDRPNQVLTVSGTMSRSCGRKEQTRVIAEAGDLFYGHFKRAWLQTGGSLSGSWMYGLRPDGAKPLYTGQSKTLFEQISAMNKYSNNVMTRQLFLTIGAELTQPPGTLAKARAVVKNRLAQMGIDVSRFFIDNGSGLSRQSQMTAAQLGRFLQVMGQDLRVAPFFEQSMSVVGVDGTLRKRLKNTPLANNAVGKTGTLDGVKTLVGYLTAQSGRKFVYVILLEGQKAKTGRPLMDDIMLWIYYNQ